LLGIVPLPIHFVPAIAIGNAVIVLAYALILKNTATKSTGFKLSMWIVAIIVGAVAKFAALYASVNYMVIPLMTTVKGTPAKAPAAIISTQQMITASIGGLLALLVVPVVIKARKKG